MSKVKISIIVAAFNVKPYLPKCIESLINQSYRNIQIILVNDGSTDGSDVICEDYSKDNRVTLISKNNEGLSSARNEGVKQVQGDYFFFVDGDDYIELDACERIAQFAENNVDLIAFNYFGNATDLDNESLDVMSGRDYYVQKSKEGKLSFNAWLFAFKKSFWFENGFCFKNGILHEDLQLIPNVILKADSILLSGFSYYHYITREESITNSHQYLGKRKKSIDEIMLQWYEKSQEVSDYALKKAILGMLSKCYVYSCAQNEVFLANKGTFSKVFLIKNAINTKEAIKAMAFSIMPKLYIYYFKRRHKNRQLA